MIQIRHVPDELHRRLRTKAALAGMSLSDYLRQELERSAEHLTVAEVRSQLAALEPVRLKESSAKVIRRARDAGDRR
jgi:plasmid stability protein